MSEKHIGKVIQVIGPVLDIQFEDGQLPELLNAIEIDNHGEKLIVEVAQLTGRQCGPLHRNEQHRWLGARHRGRGYRRVHQGARRRPVLRPRVQPAGRAGGQQARPGSRGLLAHPPPCPPATTSSRAPPRSWKPASRSSILSAPMPRAARSGCSAAPASAKPS